MDGERDALSFYIDVKPGELVDLEVAATAAIAWSQGIKAAAQNLYPDDQIRVTLIAAEHGSSNWMAKIEHSSINRGAEKVHAKWKAIPLIVRVGIGLVVVVPVTAKPTWEYWTGNEGFSEKQKQELKDIIDQARTPPVESQQKKIYKTLQRDPKITGVGTGVPTGPRWKPEKLVPANQFAEADGLFTLQEEQPSERTLTPTLDVILVSPQLENAPRTWTFRQEGIQGTIKAIMKDKQFLAALDRSAVREQFRANIPMRIRLEVTERLINGEWKVVRKGRTVAEVIEPKVDL
jgi:hypothetical protein